VGGVEERPLTCLLDLGLAVKMGQLAPGEAYLLPTLATTSNEDSTCKSLTQLCLVVESNTASPPALCAHSYSHVCRHTRMHEHTFAHIWRGICADGR